MSPKSQPYVAVDNHQDPKTAAYPSGPRPRAGKVSRWASWTSNGWLLEIASTILGIALIVALVVFLKEYDGKPSPQFGDFLGTALTLNTVVAILSATSKASLLWPVAECMSQLKWLWFAGDRARPLVDLATFDVASRSTWGGFELIWRTRLRTLAVVGSLLMLLSIAIDPLSQQLVSVEPTSVSSEDPLHAAGDNGSQASASSKFRRPGTIPVSHSWGEGSGQQATITILDRNRKKDAYVGYGAVTSRTRGAILRGLSNGEDHFPEIQSTCATSNCTFEEYETLAVCSSFVNVTSHLERTEDDNKKLPFPDVRYALSKDHFIRAGAFFNATPVASLDVKAGQDRKDPALDFASSSIAFKNVSLPLADLFVFYPLGIFGEKRFKNGTTQLGHLQYGVTEVLLEWCVQKRTTEVKSGKTTTRILSEKRGFDENGEYRITMSTFDFDPARKDPSYLVAEDTHTSTSYYLSRLLQGSITLEEADVFASTDFAPTLFEPFNVYFAYNSDDDADGPKGTSWKGSNMTGLETIFNNIAESMTNLVRSDREVSEGIQYRQELLVRIRWSWIAAHAVLIGLSLILLTSTMLLQRTSPLRGQAWKSSTLAVVHALDPVLQRASGGISDEPTLAKSAEGKMVSLSWRGGDGWRLMEGKDKLSTGSEDAEDVAQLRQRGSGVGESHSMSSLSYSDRRY